MATASTNFRRAQSKVWWSNDFSERPYYDDVAMTIATSGIELTTTTTTVTTPKTPEMQHNASWINRQGSPSSHKSQDSGFSDSETSPQSQLVTSNITDENEQQKTATTTNLIKDSVEKNLLNIKMQTTPDKLTPKKNVNYQINEHIYQRSPSTSSEPITPPTVIRRKVNPNDSNDIHYAARRISFSAPSSPTVTNRQVSPDISVIEQIDSLNYSSTSPLNFSYSPTDDSHRNCNDNNNSIRSSCKCTKDRSIKRGRVVSRSPRVSRSLVGCFPVQPDDINIDESCDITLSRFEDNLDTDESLNASTPKSILKTPRRYNNETVVFGCGLNDDNNNNVSIKSQEICPNDRQLPTYSELYPTRTSTPKMCHHTDYTINTTNTNHTENSPVIIAASPRLEANASSNRVFFPFVDIPLPIYTEYSNPLLNGNTPSVQHWLDDLRMSYNHEVMSTLQTKSITVEAARNIKLTSTIAAKVIRKVQEKAVFIQNEFEKVETVLRNDCDETIIQMPPLIQSLAGNVTVFMEKQRDRCAFYADCGTNLARFEDMATNVMEMATDLRIAVGKIYDLDDLETIREDIQILKRYVLIGIRFIFEKLIKVIITSIEETKCDLILRSSLSTISNLSNIDYTGFASLNDAFIANEAVRVLLMICIESKQSSVRALALRALATICSIPEAIHQMEQAGGVEILKDILADDIKSNTKRLEPEFRETVSVLTQITAPWHGAAHKVDGLKECVESLVENITQIVVSTTCCQTLLLCCACLNNFSRIEKTSIYSLMSHETVLKLKTACESRGPGASIFLYEQITSLLFNMATNKKCHNHLANKQIINFLILIFQSKFYEKFITRAELDAQKKTIKNILHIFARLIHESIVGQEILENNIIPIFSKIEHNLSSNSEYIADISFINKKLNESILLHNKSGPINDINTTKTPSPPTSTTNQNNKKTYQKIHKTRRFFYLKDDNRMESYV